MPAFSPAQEALILIHERILESEGAGYNGDDDEEYGPRVGANRVATRLVVSRTHVGCLLGKGGKIIEQMRVETRTQIRVLPRDNNLPRCVAISEEIVQVLDPISSHDLEFNEQEEILSRNKDLEEIAQILDPFHLMTFEYKEQKEILSRN